MGCGNIFGMFEATVLEASHYQHSFPLLFLSVCWRISLSWGIPISRVLSFTPIPLCPCKELKVMSKQNATSGLKWTDSWETQLSTQRSLKVNFQAKKLKCSVSVFSWPGSNEWSFWWTPAGPRQRALSPFWAHLHTKWRQRKHVSH